MGDLVRLVRFGCGHLAPAPDPKGLLDLWAGLTMCPQCKMATVQEHAARGDLVTFHDDPDWITGKGFGPGTD